MTIRPPVPLSSLSPGDIFALETDPHKAYSLLNHEEYSKTNLTAFAWQDNNIWYRYQDTQILYTLASNQLVYLLSPSLNPIED